MEGEAGDKGKEEMVEGWWGEGGGGKEVIIMCVSIHLYLKQVSDGELMDDMIHHHMSIGSTEVFTKLHETTYLVEGVVGEKVHEVVLFAWLKEGG